MDINETPKMRAEVEKRRFWKRRMKTSFELFDCDHDNNKNHENEYYLNDSYYLSDNDNMIYNGNQLSFFKSPKKEDWNQFVID